MRATLSLFDTKSYQLQVLMLTLLWLEADYRHRHLLSGLFAAARPMC